MMRRPLITSFKSNGERIYYTATSTSGDEITATGGPHWFWMHGGSCVDCHGADGRGGLVHMTNEIAPDIRYKALTAKPLEMEDHEEHPPYTDALIKRAISKGLDPAGEPLSYVMPRWHTSDRDLNDLVDYLKKLNGETD
jgi:mono/diheme cytochrome c family protein